MMRISEPGWIRVGAYDEPKRRSLWIRQKHGVRGVESIEVCAGREGDDAYGVIDAACSAFEALLYATAAAACTSCTEALDSTEEERGVCRECASR